MIDLSKLTISGVLKHINKKDFSARELAQSYLDRIKESNAEINAYLEVYDDVLAQADAVDKNIKSGQAGSLSGIPMSIKDNILVEG